MFLKNIHLQNFKCLGDIELSFENADNSNRKWTLILGENGTGKSNLLKAIALVTGGSNSFGELIGDSDWWIRKGKDYCLITAIIETKKGDERKIFLRFNRGDNLSKIIANNHEALKLIDDAIERAERNYFVVAYGASRRLSNDPFGGFDRSHRNYGRSLNVRSLFDNSFALNPLTSWVIELDYLAGAKGLGIVKAALNDFLPGTSYHSIDKVQKQILFETFDGIVPLEQLSDGYQNMAAWIGDLLYRITEAFGNYENPLTARGLLLIDEIDLHLHPKWQRNLIDFIGKKLPNFQVVATTHSPLTAQQTDEGELYALKRNEENEVEILPFTGSPKTLLVNQLLMTPIFGLETDESLEIQQAKKLYSSLKFKGKKLNKKEQDELEGVTTYLKKHIPVRATPRSTEKELQLLSKIESALKIRESK